MGQIKAHEFEPALKRGFRGSFLFLLYGPDSGLVSERAEKLVEASGISRDDAFNYVRLDQAALAGDAGRLLDEANAIGLFGGKRLIRIVGVGNDKNLVSAIDMLAKAPPTDCTIVVEAGDIKKGASLRSAVERGAGMLAIPCYADEGRDINALIDEEMRNGELRITSAARQRLLEMLGGDRRASRMELQKLALYCRGRELVDEGDVIAVSGDAAALSLDDTVDAVLTGNMPALESSLQRLLASKTAVFLALQACLRQFQRLDTMRATMDSEGKSASQLVNAPAARIHFKRKPAVEAALRNWGGKEIAKALQHLHEAILHSRRNGALEDAIARQALLALALRSARRLSA